MLFITITHPEFLQNEAAIINELFRNGLPFLHLRKPGSSEDDFESLLCEIPPVHHPRIIIHQHHQLSESYSVHGIHLPEKKRKAKRHPKYPVVSTSFHDTSELLDCHENYEYVFLSPVFDSIFKPEHRAAFKHEELKAALSKNQQKVIALGGIMPENIEDVHQMGFYGAASLGGIWQENPVVNFLRYMKKVTPLN